MEKICPRCQKAFACRSDDILNCGCSKVNLSAEDYRYIGRFYNVCLCPICLVQLKAERQRSPKLSAVPE